jgi:DMSO/TMAO reductase YedYZ molybdopterin-dependent catalytic subunit
MRLFPETPPPGPFRAEFWRSPLRGPWLTSILGSVLLVLFGIVSLTGFLSHAAYEPSLPHNGIVDPSTDLPLLFDWPTSPAWLYVLTQGLHVSLGYMVVPVLLAKLWSVMPRLFAWPPFTSPAMALERLSIALLVSSSVFQLATGIANAQYWYPFKFNFVIAHYWGGVIFVGAFLLHFLIKLPVVVRAYRERGVIKPLRDDLLRTKPEPRDPDGLVAAKPSPPTISRRGLLAFTGAGAGLVLVGNAGQALGGPFRKVAFLAPRRSGGFPVNKTFAAAAVPRDSIGPAYRLQLRGGDRDVDLSRDQLSGMTQRSESLPIACVEGWSATRAWTGVPLRDLARIAGMPDAEEVLVTSLQPKGVLREISLTGDQIHDPRSLLALQVEGEDLTLDHGYPARIIVPALPGVHNTKWVGTLTFKRRASA